MLHTGHPSALSHQWPPGAHDRDAGASGGQWEAGSGASSGLPLLAGAQGDGRAPLHLSPLTVGPRGALPGAVLRVHSTVFSTRAFKVIPSISLWCF